MSLPSFSFGAEGVEYGRKASFYELSSGPVVLPSNLEVKGNLLVDGSTTLTGPAVVNSNLTVSGNETVGGVITVLGGTGGTALTVGQSGAPRDLVVTGTAFTGLINSSTVTATQGGTGGVAGLIVTNAGIGGNPLRSVSVFNDQSNPGTLISMLNGADAGTLAYTGTQFQLSRPLNIPVQTGSSGNLTVGGAIDGPESLTPNFRYIQIGVDPVGDGGFPTSPDGTQGANNYWTQTYDGTTVQANINAPAAGATSIYIIVLPSDFLTSVTPPVIDPKYVGKVLYRLWLAIVNTSTLTIQLRIGSVTGTQIGRSVLDGAASPGWQNTGLVSVPSVNSGATAPLYFGITQYAIPTLGGVANLPPV
jgi:hypothetical protein